MPWGRDIEDFSLLKTEAQDAKILEAAEFWLLEDEPTQKLAMLKAFTSILGWLIQFLRALCFVFHRAIVYLQLYHVNMMNEPSFCDVKDGTSMPPTADEARFWLVNYSAAPAFCCAAVGGRSSLRAEGRPSNWCRAHFGIWSIYNNIYYINLYYINLYYIYMISYNYHIYHISHINII